MRQLIENQPFPEYQAHPGLNNSTLWPLISRSPAHAKAQREAPPTDPTPALVLGSAIHAAVLEPTEFELAFVVAPECDRRTKVGKAVWAEFQHANQGKTILKQDQYDTAIACRDSVWSHRVARDLLAGKTTDGFEASIYWEEEVAGRPLQMKARIDIPSQTDPIGFVLADLKSTQDAGPTSFGNSVGRYGYGLQAFMYQRGWAAVTGERPQAWFWIAVEKEPPYGVAVYECGAGTLERAEAAYHRALKLWRMCEESGEWPCYPEEIELLEAPSWAPGLPASENEGVPPLALEDFG